MVQLCAAAPQTLSPEQTGEDIKQSTCHTQEGKSDISQGSYVQLLYLSETELNRQIGFVMDELPDFRWGVFVPSVERTLSLHVKKLLVPPCGELESLIACKSH